VQLEGLRSNPLFVRLVYTTTVHTTVEQTRLVSGGNIQASNYLIMSSQ
jgi:hypothetical protein